jgi:hypothetical protein
MCGFCRITDLGILLSNFSSKHNKGIYIFGESCSSYYTEHNKIEFAIFGFFYDFILNLQVAVETQQRWRIIFHKDPWKDLWVHIKVLGLHKTPQNHLKPYNVPLGAWGRCGRWNSVDLADELGREVAREELGVEQARSECSLAAGRRPEGVYGGDPSRRPLEWLLWRAGGSAWPTSGGGTSVGVRGRREHHVSAVKSGQRRISPWAPMGQQWQTRGRALRRACSSAWATSGLGNKWPG